MLSRMHCINPFNEFSHDECLRLIAEPEHHFALRETAKFARVSSSEDYFSVTLPFVLDGVTKPEVHLKMRTHEGHEPPLIPRLPLFNVDAIPEHRVKLITAHVERRLYDLRMCATIREILSWLSENCDNGHQVRYLYPAVMHLYQRGVDVHADKWAEKYGAFKAARFTPSVSTEMRKAMIETSTWLTQASMLTDVKGPELGPVEIHLAIAAAFEFEGSVVYR